MNKEEAEDVRRINEIRKLVGDRNLNNVGILKSRELLEKIVHIIRKDENKSGG